MIQLSKIQRLIGYLFLCSLLFYVVTFLFWTKLPDKSFLDKSIFSQPLQTETDEKPFEMKVGNKLLYKIKPLYDYELFGLVVSENDNEAWYSRFKKSDSLNDKDLCVLYGDNAKLIDFKEVSFKSEEFVCLFRFNQSVKFNFDEISNNHLLVSKESAPLIYRKIREAKKGDQIHFKGHLVEYEIYENGIPKGSRGSSITRKDTGMGACETVFLTDFEIIKKGNPVVSTIHTISGNLSVFFLIAWIVIFFYIIYLPSRRETKEIINFN